MCYSITGYTYREVANSVLPNYDTKTQHRLKIITAQVHMPKPFSM